MSAPAISLRNVSKLYRRYGGRQFATLKSALLSGDLVRKLRPEETFQALSDVSFDVPAGQTLGVIGRNGSGKSTALKLVAGITKPTSGSVVVKGRVSALIELGAGFHPEISGRENVFINGVMLGMSKREIQRRFDEIVDFAELRDFIDAPVKTYSSGMYMRLGFAVAIHVDPDVLLVDEVLAVGDEAFTHKCLDKFAEFKRRNKTILLVTHSLGLVERTPVGRANLYTVNEQHYAIAPLRALLDPLAALREVAAAAGADAVILFGSVARGEATAGSDIDLAVLAGGSWDGRAELEDAVRARLGSDCDVLVFTPEQFERLAASGDEPVVQEILADGVALAGAIPRPGTWVA